MLSNEKIKWMTRAALYEKKEGKGSIRINRFRKSDYISWNMIKSIVGMTMGYALVIFLYLLGVSESMLDELTLPYVINIGMRFLFVYLVLLVITGFAASPVAAFALGLPYLRKKPVRAMQVCFKLPYLIFQFCTFQL